MRRVPSSWVTAGALAFAVGVAFDDEFVAGGVVAGDGQLVEVGGGGLVQWPEREIIDDQQLHGGQPAALAPVEDYRRIRIATITATAITRAAAATLTGIRLRNGARAGGVGRGPSAAPPGTDA